MLPFQLSVKQKLPEVILLSLELRAECTTGSTQNDDNWTARL